MNAYNTVKNAIGISNNNPNEFTATRAAQAGCTVAYNTICDALEAWKDVSAIYP